ncbi:MAG: diphosphomevalonate decarboxylase [Lentisphaeria bacterium]|nr:diphosphomevalonate decarboxylase [Lentisphaeria bacterium]NQZ67062.1 diphosphomevalonate decarboxylase [Lentisphaeria bacterium]
MTLEQYLANTLPGVTDIKDVSRAFAPSNIALCKYWGKRQEEFNLPVNSSLSISLGNLGTETSLECSNTDILILNGEELDSSDPFSTRLFNYIDLFRPPSIKLKIETSNTIPTAAGLASSASGFAAVIKALSDLFSWDLSDQRLSEYARIGSGSACRSIYHGFVLWEKGEKHDGSDSFAHLINNSWTDLRLAILDVCSDKKAISSRDAMNRTASSSPYFTQWSDIAQSDLALLLNAIEEKDLHLLMKTAESNAMAMHASMMAAQPTILYFLAESVEMMHKVWACRSSGLSVYFTMDAGPNLKLLYHKDDEAEVLKQFPDAISVNPFVT